MYFSLRLKTCYYYILFLLSFKWFNLTFFRNHFQHRYLNFNIFKKYQWLIIIIMILNLKNIIYIFKPFIYHIFESSIYYISYHTINMYTIPYIG